MNFLSTNIKYLRQEKGLTQEDLAKIVGKSRVLVSQWESDDREITTEDIIKLSDYFNVPMDYLVGKDLRFQNDNKLGELEILFNKAKDKLDPSQEATIKFVMQDAIKKYEEEKNKGSEN